MPFTVVASDSFGSDYDVAPPNVDGGDGTGSAGGAGGAGGSFSGKGVVGSGVSQGSKMDIVSVSRYNFENGPANTTVFGSTVLDNGWVDKVESSLPFAKNNDRPVGTKVPGVLQNAANYPALTRSIHYAQTCTAGTCAQGVRTYKLATAIRANYYNRFTGAFTVAVPVSIDGMGPDAAAVPTRAIPGTLTYMPLFNGIPKTTNYVAKT